MHLHQHLYIYLCIYQTLNSHHYLQFQASNTELLKFFFPISYLGLSPLTVKNLAAIILNIFSYGLNPACM